MNYTGAQVTHSSSRYSAINAEWDVVFRKMVAGDDAAFESLFASFNPKLQRYILKQLGAGPHVDDLLQEVWTRVIQLRERSREGGQEATYQVQAFLFRIARNLVIDFLRTRKDHSSLQDVDEALHPRFEAGELSDPESLVGRAMDLLSFDFREILVLNLHLGYRLDEIAVMLEKSPDAMWARASRARAKLRRLVIELAEKEGVSLRAYLPSETDQV